MRLNHLAPLTGWLTSHKCMHPVHARLGLTSVRSADTSPETKSRLLLALPSGMPSGCVCILCISGKVIAGEVLASGS
jgi:hypothetical protein